ncbi:MAG: phosphatidate cytidylyltransferase [Phycisphaerae bacterium]|nr:phosphatidate cytidylyltransferase [Phycisphaerae bacterium]
MLLSRVLLGSLMIVALGGLIALDAWLSVGEPPPGLGSDGYPPMETGIRFAGLPVVAVAMLLVVLAAFEFGALLRLGGYRPVTLWAALVSAGLVVIPWLPPRLSVSGESMTVVWLMGGVIGAALAAMARKTTERATTAMATTVLIIVYLGVLGSFFVRIRFIDPGPAGAILLVYTVLTIKAADIGAYFTGMCLGRHALAPWLSPKKTVEGFLGAMVVSAGVAAGGAAFWPVIAPGSPPFGVLQALVFGVLMAVMGHLGDLAESAIKRDIGVKDSAALIPAFGGLLDLLDSTLFAAPVAWWMLTFMPKIG